tara:strand:+ start:60 stop:452 length:393 start_codon:yes stop_codon:yes gene_type:complete
MEISGNIKKIMPEQQVNPTFKKRELVVTTDEQYPQHILVEFTQDRSDLLNRYEEGQNVTISINIRGREWTPKEGGDTRYFNTIQGWRIQASESPAAGNDNSGQIQAGGAPVASTPPAPNTNSFNDDDLPF